MNKALVALLLTTLALYVFTGTALPTAAAEPSNTVLVFLAASPFPGAPDGWARVTPVLSSLHKHGHISSFAWLADANAFQVNGLDGTAAQLLYGLEGVTRISPASASALESARQAQRELYLNSQRAGAHYSTLLERTSDTPYFEVIENEDQLQGKGLAPNQAVTAVLKDSGDGVKTTLNATADGNGFFQDSFEADVVQGDYVEITYNSTTVTIHSDAITIDFDYENDHITGTAGANRTLYLNVHDDGFTGCPHESNLVSATNGAGSFDADFGGTAFDIIRRTRANVVSVNADGNGWNVSRQSPWLVVNTQVDQMNGKGVGLAPGKNVVIKLKAVDETLKANADAKTNTPDASFGFGLGGADMLPGDTLSVTEEGNNWATIPIVALDVLLNPANGRVTGHAPANEQVFLCASRYDPNTGNWNNTPQTVSVDASGNFSTTFTGPFIGGDSVWAYYADAAGFEQAVSDTAPNLFLYKDLNLVQGRMHANFDGEVNVTVVSKKGDSKYQGKGYAFGGWWSMLLAKNGSAVKLAAQDSVTAAPVKGSSPQAAGVLSAQVAKLTAKLDVNTDIVTGTTAKKAKLGVSAQMWYGDGYQCRDECEMRVKPNGSGAYTYDFNQDLQEGDFAEIRAIDNNGNVTIKRAFSTTPAIVLDSFPPTFRRGRPNPVKYTISGGIHAHVQDMGILADSVTRPDWRYTMQNGPEGISWPAGPGPYTVNVWTAHQGKIYFRAFAMVDGQYIITNPESSARAR